MYECVGSSLWSLDGPDVVVEDDDMDVEVRLQESPFGVLTHTVLEPNRELHNLGGSFFYLLHS